MDVILNPLAVLHTKTKLGLIWINYKHELRNTSYVKYLPLFPTKEGGSYLAEVGNLPNFMAENGNIAWFQRVSDTKTVMETEISYFRG